MGKPQRRFGKEFEAEAVRLLETSGRTQRGFYNPVRRHSALDFISPLQFEKLAA